MTSTILETASSSRGQLHRPGILATRTQLTAKTHDEGNNGDARGHVLTEAPNVDRKPDMPDACRVSRLLTCEREPGWQRRLEVRKT